MIKIHVEINRVHKGSPYNCAYVIPELLVSNVDYSIFHKTVLNAIATTFGKDLIVIIYPVNQDGYLSYEIKKPKAKCTTQEILDLNFTS